MMDWRHRAGCRSAPEPDLFFPTGSAGPALLQLAEAKAVCRRCPVTADCLAWAIATGQDTGVWGGLSEDERRDLQRRLARIAAGGLTASTTSVRAATLAPEESAIGGTRP